MGMKMLVRRAAQYIRKNVRRLTVRENLMRLTASLCTLIWFCAVAHSLAAQQDGARAPSDTIRYREVGGSWLNAYLFRPEVRRQGDRYDTVLLFHGGGWDTGAPEWTFPAARRFAEWGMVAIAVEYQLSGNNVTPIEAFEDVCKAIGWAHKHAVEYGLTGRLAGYGVSAGAQLVAATATVGCPLGENEEESSELDALLLWSPALDMRRDQWFTRMLQGRATASEYSPAENVRRTTPPTSIVIGAEDTLTPFSGSRLYCDRLIAFGGICELNIYEGVGHLLTRNLANQESAFDPDPRAKADGVEQHRRFLKEVGFALLLRR